MIQEKAGMKRMRRLSRILVLTGLLLALTACAGSSALPARHTPTVQAATPTPTATAQPSPTPFGGASAQLGPLPQTCQLSAIRKPKTISPEFAPMVGAGPVWIGGIIAYKQVPLALAWSPEEASTYHDQYGWEHKDLWVVATTLQGSVTIRGTNLSTGALVHPSAEYAEDSSTPTAMVLNPSDPTVVSQDANQNAQWTQFPGGLAVPGAGCYSLEAIWPGGSWHMTFAVGVVPGFS